KFWPNVSRVRLNDTNTQLGTLTGSTQPGLLVTSSGRQKLFRGGSDGGCGDYEQTFFDPAHPNEFRPDPAHVQTTTVNDVNVVQCTTSTPGRGPTPTSCSPATRARKATSPYGRRTSRRTTR